LIITADHGEEFYDHGGWGHRHQLHDELLHVPLVIRWPEGEKAGTRVATPASLVDLAPTILDVLGLRIPPQFEGTSLRAFIDAPYRQRPLLAQREGQGQIDAWVEEDWKIIRNSTGKVALYNRVVDELEQHDVADQNPERAGEMQNRLDSFLAGLKTRSARREREMLNQRELEQLRTLGYVD
jgi:arylsulfatase A-like enzyme